MFQHLRGEVYPKKLAHLLVLSQVESGVRDELHLVLLILSNVNQFVTQIYLHLKMLIYVQLYITGLNCDPVPRIQDLLR